jgi:protein-disulfide isomerase
MSRGAGDAKRMEGREAAREERREAAREERRVVEQAARDRVTQRRFARLGWTVAAAIVVVGAAIVLSGTGGGGGGRDIARGAGAGAATVGQVSTLLVGIPEAGTTLGDPKAPVTLEYFGDLECPYCQLFTLGALPSLIETYVRGGRLKIEYGSVETATRDPAVFEAQQVAALAAGEQDRLWYYVELFYREQGAEDSGYVTAGYLQGLAAQVPGLNLARWSVDRGDAALAGELRTDQRVDGQAGLSGTPAFLLGRTGGRLAAFGPTSLTDPAAFDTAINRVLG